MTSQYSQKQAEELKEQLKERERKAQERRKQRLEMQTRRHAQNQNIAFDDEEHAGIRLWKKITGSAA